MMKKRFALLLILTLSMSLMACATKTAETTVAPATAATTAAATTAAATEAETEATVTDDFPATAAAFLEQEGIKLSVQMGTVGDWLAQDLVGEDNVDQYHQYVDAISALKTGKVQGTVMDLGPAQKIVAVNTELFIYDDALTEENYAFGLKKGNTELLDAVNAALKDLLDSGELQAIFDKYINEEEGAGDDIDFNVGAAGGKLIMGTESGFPPYEMRRGDDIVGIDVEIMAAVAKAIDKELVIEDMQFNSLTSAVDSGKIDIIAAGLSVTEERAKEIDFSDDYVIGAKQVLVVKREG